jgi:hypothetical protein
MKEFSHDPLGEDGQGAGNLTEALDLITKALNNESPGRA